MFALKGFFFLGGGGRGGGDFLVEARKLASLFSHPTQVSTQVSLMATCDNYTCESIWLGLNNRCSK